jgi:hypothetical protein
MWEEEEKMKENKTSSITPCFKEGGSIFATFSQDHVIARTLFQHLISLTTKSLTIG